jgi:formamidopyrimidine-DNA glycosylase
MGTNKRASLHVVQGRGGLAEHDPQGLEIFAADLSAFGAALTRENHTLKRTLTDPRVLSGIGNAYSDEILHRAKLSPIKQTKTLHLDEISRLFHAAKECLSEWIERLRRDTGESFPERVTAFRDEMAVHGRYRKPCPVCGAPVQRIAYAENETNYCARCQTGGRLLADRSLSRLLKSAAYARRDGRREKKQRPVASAAGNMRLESGGARSARDVACERTELKK